MVTMSPNSHRTKDVFQGIVTCSPEKEKGPPGENCDLQPLRWLEMVKHSNFSAFNTCHTKKVQEQLLVKLFYAFNSKEIEVTLTTTNVSMATLKEVKDTLFYTFRG